jgi:hypothetical protein
MEIRVKFINALAVKDSFFLNNGIDAHYAAVKITLFLVVPDIKLYNCEVHCVPTKL